MIYIAKIMLIAVVASITSACITIPSGRTSESSTASSGPGSRVVSTPSKAELEAQRRSELSKNDKRVTFRPKCDGLFIPEVKRTMFQGLVPVYSIFVLNNSENRYSVKYDVTFLETTQNISVRSASESTEEKKFIARPNSYTRFEIAMQEHGAGQRIADVRKIVVLSCEKT